MGEEQKPEDEIYFFDYLSEFNLAHWLADFRGISLHHLLEFSDASDDSKSTAQDGAYIVIYASGDIYLLPPLLDMKWILSSGTTSEANFQKNAFILPHSEFKRLSFKAGAIGVRVAKGRIIRPRRILLSPDRTKLMVDGHWRNQPNFQMAEFILFSISDENPYVIQIMYRELGVVMIDACFTHDSRFLVVITRKHMDSLIFLNISWSPVHQPYTAIPVAGIRKKRNVLQMISDGPASHEKIEKFLFGNETDNPEDVLDRREFSTRFFKDRDVVRIDHMVHTGLEPRVVGPVMCISPRKDEALSVNCVSIVGEVVPQAPSDGKWRFLTWRRKHDTAILWTVWGDTKGQPSSERVQLRSEMERIDINQMLISSLQSPSDIRILHAFLAGSEAGIFFLLKITSFKKSKDNGIGILRIMPKKAQNNSKYEYDTTWFKIADTMDRDASFSSNMVIDTEEGVIHGALCRVAHFSLNYKRSELLVSKTHPDAREMGFYAEDTGKKKVWVTEGSNIHLQFDEGIASPRSPHSVGNSFKVDEDDAYEMESMECVKFGMKKKTSKNGWSSLATPNTEVAVGLNLFTCNTCGRVLLLPLVCGRCHSSPYCSIYCQKYEAEYHRAQCRNAVRFQGVRNNVV